METTRLSSKGQVIIPKALRDAHHWVPGTELIAIELNGGIFLRPASAFTSTTIQQAAACLKQGETPYDESAVEQALSTFIQENWNASD